jgi:NitT/TauT family transport system ATP-binding protein
MLNTPKLEVRQVSKFYQHGHAAPKPVMQSLSLHVPNLEFVAIVGPSGCGKSTLLRMIDGLVSCDEGSIFLNGRDVTRITGGEGRGMVFQSFDLLPWRTVRQNVELGLELKGLRRSERTAVSDHYLNLVALSEFRDAYPHQLSGGMQQRVGIARAFAVQPELLLMDEPFGALDVQARDILQDELLKLWEREQKTVLLVTHSIEEAVYLADRILVFSARPARIERDIRVTFPRPRTEELKTTPEFLELRRDIWSTLKSNVQV